MKKIFAMISVPLLLSSMIWAIERSDVPVPAPATVQSQTPEQEPEHLRIEGERRFRANCGRCHMAPEKFPPRMMGTIVRHMRVRATITDEDMKSILYYMTQ